MGWVKVKLPDSAEPNRVFQIANLDFAVDADGHLIAFRTYSERLGKAYDLILNKHDQPLHNWQRAFSHSFSAINTIAKEAAALGFLGLLKRPKYGKAGALIGVGAGLLKASVKMRTFDFG
jgi:hypothetical protein